MRSFDVCGTVAIRLEHVQNIEKTEVCRLNISDKELSVNLSIIFVQ